MQRRDFGWFHPLGRLNLAALAAGMLGIVGGCTGTIGPRADWQRTRRGQYRSRCHHDDRRRGRIWVGQRRHLGQRRDRRGAGNATVTGTGGAGGSGSPPVVFAPSAGAYRRLTASAFRNSLRDLLQGPVTIGELEPDSWSVGGFASVSAATVSISAAGVEQYQTAIDAATTQAFADTTRRSKLLGCTPKSATDMACFQSFVTSFGRVAWRQPLTAAQVTRYAS